LRFTEALAGLGLLVSAAVAQQPPLFAQGAWVRAIPGADTAAAYLTLRNVGNHAVTVTGVESPVCGHAMIHETTTEGAQSRMRPREPLVVAAHSVVKFTPGGLHIMLHELKQPLAVGQGVPLLIKLADGTSLPVTAAVRPLGAE
jgi:copper(I)-binding protein